MTKSGAFPFYCYMLLKIKMKWEWVLIKINEGSSKLEWECKVINVERKFWSDLISTNFLSLVMQDLLPNLGILSLTIVNF